MARGKVRTREIDGEVFMSVRDVVRLLRKSSREQQSPAVGLVVGYLADQLEKLEEGD
jgi:hypothetical protein